MPIVPKGKFERVQFYQTHLTPWTSHAVAIGLTAADATELSDLTDAADAAFEAQQAAVAASRSATLDFNAAVRAMQAKGSELIQKIKAKAAGAADPDSVYSLAQIPAPANPTPVPAPGTPFELKVTLNPNGSLELAWKCLNPANSVGTIYEVRRRNLSAGPAFAFVGASGVRSFTDDTVPAGSASVLYEITAVRSTKRGTAGQFVVNFGVSGSGQMFAAVADAPRIAA